MLSARPNMRRLLTLTLNPTPTPTLTLTLTRACNAATARAGSGGRHSRTGRPTHPAYVSPTSPLYLPRISPALRTRPCAQRHACRPLGLPGHHTPWLKSRRSQNDCAALLSTTGHRGVATGAAACQQRDVTYYIDVVYSMHGSDVQPTGTQRECASDLRTNLA